MVPRYRRGSGALMAKRKDDGDKLIVNVERSSCGWACDSDHAIAHDDPCEKPESLPNTVVNLLYTDIVLLCTYNPSDLWERSIYVRPPCLRFAELPVTFMLNDKIDIFIPLLLYSLVDSEVRA